MRDADPITRLNTALEGRYRIERELGEGGMATVYLADDLRHERKVALKVLKPELAAVVGADRFLAEIKTTANLQHPHILPLFDSGEAGSFLFYVMPYVEGESLRERIDREHQLPVDEAVQIVKNVAEALDYAHRKGVIHRDIKPANILLQDAKPVVSDFGIALALGAAGAGRLTETGLSLGTPHYMAPEQATGDLNVGVATDVYALGCVLYEMLVGEPPFTGSTPQAVLGKIVTGDTPSASAERRSVPPNVDAAIRKALEKVPADRFPGAQGFASALGNAGFRHGNQVARSGSGAGTWNQLSVWTTGIAVGALGLAGWGWLRPAPVSQPEGASLRATLTDFGFVRGREGLAISRDGTLIAVTSRGEAQGALFVRRSDQVEFRPVLGTRNAESPDFSPDGQSLVYNDGEVIKRVDLSGGEPITLADGVDAHWGTEDMIVFSLGSQLHSVSPTGGRPPRSLFASDTTRGSDFFLLPDGEAVLFHFDGRLKLVEVASGLVTELGIMGSDPRYIPTGHVVFGQQDQRLSAVPFDLRRHEVTGEPFTVLPRVRVAPGGSTEFDVSDDGTAIYELGTSTDQRLVEVDLDGIVTPVSQEPGAFLHPRYSPPDGRYIAYQRGEDIWLFDRLDRSHDVLAAGAAYPVWSADGRYVYYAVPSQVPRSVFRRPVSDPEEAESVYAGDDDVRVAFPLSTAPSGDGFVMAEVVSAERSMDLAIMRESGDSVVFTSYLRGPASEQLGSISPDGRWMLYATAETGRPEIYVRGFQEQVEPIKVSPNGGFDPKWTPDQAAVLYRLQGQIMRAPVLRSDAAFEVGAPEVLVGCLSYALSSARYGGASNWDYHPGGQRLVMVADDEAQNYVSTSVPLEIFTNWFVRLREQAESN